MRSLRFPVAAALLLIALAGCVASGVSPSAAAPSAPASPLASVAAPTPAPTASPTPVPSSPAVTPAAAGGTLLLYFVAPADQGGYANGEAAVVGADGSGRRDVAQAVQASWSHDGTAIHVVTEDANCVPHLSDYPAAGGAATPSAVQFKAGDYYFRWSPDDSQVVFFRRTHGLAADLCKGTATQVDPTAMQQDLMVMNADGTNLRTLATGEGSIGPIAWTPDGKTLVWARWGQANALGPLTLVDVASGKITAITSSSLQFGVPAVSPDGSQLAYSVTDPNSTSMFSNAFVANLDGTQQVNLGVVGSSDGDPIWSPDGKSLALIRTSGSTVERGLVVVKPATKAATDVYGPVFQVDAPWSGVSWSPDGSKIACLGSSDPSSASSSGVVVVGADGTNPTPLAGTVGATQVFWQP
jgi:Tol biopolymer transport system component